MTHAHKLVILTGPPCVGKRSLIKALARVYPDVHRDLRSLVPLNSRRPRPDEIDGTAYVFRTREQVDALRKDDRFVVIDVQDDLQALDLKGLARDLEQSDVLFTGSPHIGRRLLGHARLDGIPHTSMFLSPLSYEEISFLKRMPTVSIQSLVTDLIRRKLLRLARRQRSNVLLADLQYIERRASTAYRELHEASFFDVVIPNHDGEDSENWDAFYYPLGDARKALQAFVALVQGDVPPGAEHWEEGLLP